MEENNLVPSNPQHPTREIIQAMFNRELGLNNYKKIIEAASALTFSKDNLSADYPALKELDKLLKNLDEVRKKIKEPYVTTGKVIESTFKEITAPMEEILTQKKGQLRTANEAAMMELKKAQQEQERKDNINRTLASFINEVTLAVGNASDDKEITRIQKLIGSEKAKKSFYAELYNELLNKCDGLEQPIKDRKSFIQQTMANEKLLQAALNDGDDEKAVKLREEQELLQEKTNESKIRLEEAAFEQVSTIQSVVGQPIIETVKPKSKRWKWRVDDITLLQKKLPHLVKLVPNDEAIDELMKLKRAENALIDDEELKIFGLTFFQEKFY